MTRSSNRTGLAYAREVEGSLGTLPVTPNWITGEPNSYNDHGGTLTTVARQPINASRQIKKGAVVDKDAVAGFQSDFTQTNMNSLFESCFFANFRLLNRQTVTSVSGTAYTKTSHGYEVGDLIAAKGFTNSSNNGFKEITATTANTYSCSGLVVEASPPATAVTEKVGIQAPSNGDIQVNADGNLTSTTFDFTTLQLVGGEWIFIGGDSASTAFSESANNGFKRVSAISANLLTIDKSSTTMALDTAAGVTVQIFVANRLRNEPSPDDIKVISHQFERSLSGGGYDYVIGAIANTMNLTVGTAGKVEIDLNFVGIDVETRTQVQGEKSGDREVLITENLFNTSSDVKRMKIASTSAVSLSDFVLDFNISLNNNLSPDKAVSVLGAIGVTEGFFNISGSANAYFTDVSTIEAVQNNTDVTIDLIMAKENSGFAFDIPLLGLGEGKPDIQINTPITLPLSYDAGESSFGHTALVNQWVYLPDLAMV